MLTLIAKQKPAASAAGSRTIGMELDYMEMAKASLAEIVLAMA